MNSSEDIKVEEKPLKTSKVCSSYDDECKDVPNPLYCFLNPTCGVADGICPLLTNLN